MIVLKREVLILCVVGMLVEVHSNSYADTVANSWIILMNEAKDLFRKCDYENSLLPWRCIKSSSIQIFDRIANCNVIPLTQNMRLKRVDRANDPINLAAVSDDDSSSTSSQYIKTDAVQNGKTMKFTDESNWKTTADVHNDFFEGLFSPSFNSNDTWSQHVFKKMAQTLNTHVLEIDFVSDATATARHRRRNQMLPMMMFGVTAFGMIIVPVGFQFLAVMSGKAMLLAKMALLLASVNGLKRVATHGVHYGFYHTPPTHGHGFSEGFYDRNSPDGTSGFGPRFT